MEIDQVIAENLKKLREQQNLSLAQLAKKTGLSKVMLGQLEKGGSNPTINNIWKITNALGVPYTALLEEQNSTAEVIHGKDLLVQASEDGHYRVTCYYAGSPQRNFEWFRMELDGCSSYTSIGHREGAWEYILLAAGTLELETQGKKYTLQPGDSLSFPADSRHRYSNPGRETVQAYIINHYPF